MGGFGKSLLHSDLLLPQLGCIYGFLLAQKAKSLILLVQVCPLLVRENRKQRAFGGGEKKKEVSGNPIGNLTSKLEASPSEHPCGPWAASLPGFPAEP